MDEIDEEFKIQARKNLIEWFGSFDEFHEKVSRNVKHGLVRSKIKSRSSPFVSLQITHDSPIHIPVHVALQSMRNLVEEPLSALPIDFMPLKGISSQEVEAAARESSSSSAKTGLQREKRKKVCVDEERSSSESKRRKADYNVIKDKEETGIAFSPDSRVQSTEAENVDESSNVEAMLSIMTSLEEPQLSPISDAFIRTNRSLERKLEPSVVVSEMESVENGQKRQSSATRNGPSSVRNREPTPAFQPDSSMSPASTSRETSPVAPPPRPQVVPPVSATVPSTSSAVTSSANHRSHSSSFQEPTSSVVGNMRLKGLKADKIEKLLEIAKKSGKIVEEKREKNSNPPFERSNISSKKTERKEVTPVTSEAGGSTRKEERSSRNEDHMAPKLQNKTVRSLAKEVTTSKLSPSAPSPRSISSVNTPTPHSRPSSSLSTHDPMHPSSVEPPSSTSNPVKLAPASSMSSAQSSATKPPRWACQWEHTKLKTIQRVPIPDPTNPSGHKSKGDFYHALAKDWKLKADKSKDRVMRPLNYMLSSVFFVMEAITKSDRERTPQARMQCVQIYRDTHELLGVAIFQGIRDTEDAIAAHILPRIKILGQIMLSVMQYQLYIFRSEQAIKNYTRLESREVNDSIDVRASSTTSDASTSAATNKHMNNLGPPSATSASSTPSSIVAQASPWRTSISSCSMTVTMPQVVFDLMKSQVKTANTLVLASRYWEDSKNLARQVDVGFIKHIETVCGKSFAMDMPFDVLAQFVLTAIGSLKAEYDEEQKLGVKPILAKVKPAMDIAIKTGSFHSLMPDRTQRTSQTTPRLPTPLPTVTSNPSHNHSLSK